MNDIVDAVRFIKMPEVLAMTGLGKSTVYRLMAEGTFPASRSYEHSPTNKFWLLHEVEDWQRRVLNVKLMGPEEGLEKDPIVYFEYATEHTILSRTQIRDLIRKGEFPSGIAYSKIPHLRRWKKSELDNWLAQRPEMVRDIKAEDLSSIVESSKAKGKILYWYMPDLVRETHLKRQQINVMIIDGMFPEGEKLHSSQHSRRWKVTVVEDWLRTHNTVKV